MRRRRFIRTVAGGLTFSLLGEGNSFSSDRANVLALDHPFDGAILHERCGAPVLGVGRTPDGRKFLKIRVSGTAPAESSVTICCPSGEQVAAQRKGKEFFAEVRLTEKLSTVKASALVGGRQETAAARVLWVKNTHKRFRFQIDDNVFFLRDIHPKLNAKMTHPNQAEVLNLTTHEQYTWPFYKRYIPDHLQRLDAALGIAVEHGYKPAWFHDDFCEDS